jgi:hypothetical protein
VDPVFVQPVTHELKEVEQHLLLNVIVAMEWTEKLVVWQVAKCMTAMEIIRGERLSLSASYRDSDE